ncbi:hypothetical protein BD310DRAFT_661134 [Dichomitus squalens]|uniref:Uncharacterized protein n=1 Tax=Dichomitus squalens TaxID=114155 RepID=A0A4V2K986_9APHY|nr:hypothetical protein BD310DRAFT_661134 [Dichomitus squalens]
MGGSFWSSIFVCRASSEGRPHGKPSEAILLTGSLPLPANTHRRRPPRTSRCRLRGNTDVNVTGYGVRHCYPALGTVVFPWTVTRGQHVTSSTPFLNLRCAMYRLGQTPSRFPAARTHAQVIIYVQIWLRRNDNEATRSHRRKVCRPRATEG